MDKLIRAYQLLISVNRRYKLNRKKVIIAVLIFDLTIIPLLLLFNNFRAKQTSAAWWDDTWSYRQTVEIHNTGSAQTDFQVLITLDTSALVTAGKMQNDCDDIRITDINGKLLPIWIESRTNTCNTSTTAIWTKIPSISATGTTLYLYYGNPSANNIQNGNEVFLFFDDFSSNLNKWTMEIGTSSDIYIESNYLKINTTAHRSLGSSASYSNFTDGIIEFKYYLGNASSIAEIAFRGNYSGNTGYKGRLDARTNQGIGFLLPPYATWGFWTGSGPTGIAVPNSQWLTGKMAISGTTVFEIQYDKTTATTQFTSTGNSTYQSAGSISLQQHNGTYALYDDVIVRKYAASEPHSETPANEEKSQGPIAYWKFDEGQGVTAQNSTWKKTGTMTNLIVNPSVEVDTTNWYPGSGNTITKTSSYSMFGGSSASVTRPGSGGTIYNTWNSIIYTAGQTYRLSMYVRKSDGSAVTTSDISDMFLENVTLGVESITSVGNNWYRVLSGTRTATGSNSNTGFYMAAGLTVYIDGVQVEQSSTTSNYCDGSLLGNGSRSWAGTAHASTSTCDTGTDGDINGASWQTEDMCVSGKCLKFNGSTSYVSIPTNSSLHSADLTVSLWFKLNSINADANIGTVLASDYGSSNDWIFYVLSTGSICLRVHPSSGNTCSSTGVVSTNQWYHTSFTITNNSSELIYLNGAQVANGSYANTSSSNAIAIGTAAWSPGNNTVNGFIDDVKIYNYVRTVQQIRLDYNSGLAGAGVAKGTGVSFGAKSDKWLSDGLVGYWKLDESGSSNAIDSSGNGNTLTKSQGTYTTGKFGNGLDVESSTDFLCLYIADNASLSITSNITTSAWIKPESVTAGTFFEITGKWADANKSYLLTQYGDEIRFYVNSINNYVTSNSVDLVAGTWYFVSAVYNASAQTVTLYVNGQSVASTISGTIPASISDGAEVFYIGANDYSDGSPYDGIIDEVRVYNRALNPSEVEGLYNWAPGPVGYWNFEEGKGPTFYDKSGNGYNGAITGALYNQGKYGKALKFTDATDAATISATINNIKSVSFWVNPATTSLDLIDFDTTKKISAASGTISASGITSPTYYVNGVPSTTLVANQWQHVEVTTDTAFNNTSLLGIGKLSTTFSGTIASNTTWSKNVLITGDVTVNSGVTLTISPGVTVLFAANSDDTASGTWANKSELIINGALNAVGTIDRPITFTSNAKNKAKEDWGMIALNGSNSTIKYTSVSYAVRGIFEYSFNSTIAHQIENCNISNNTYGLYLFSPSGYPVFNYPIFNGWIKNSMLDSNTTGIQIQQDNGYGSSLSNFLIQNNIIQNSTLNGYYSTATTWWLGQTNNTSELVKWNTFKNNSPNGIVINLTGPGDCSGWDSHYQGTINLNYFTGNTASIRTQRSGNTCLTISGNLNPSIDTNTFDSSPGIYIDWGSPTSTNNNFTNDRSNGSGNTSTDYPTVSPTISLIDEVKIYNYVRTQKQIVEDMNAGHPAPGSPVGSALGYWKFDEGYGTNISNSGSAGTTITSTATSTTWTPNGKFGKALMFNGTTPSRVDMGNPASLQITSNLTISSWIKLDNINATYGRGIVSKYYNTATNKGYRFGVASSTGTLTAEISSDCSNGTLKTSVGTITPQIWTYVAMVYRASAGAVDFYINGDLNNTQTGMPTAICNSPQNFQIGTWDVGLGNHSFVGSLDEVKVYNFALTAEEIKLDYNRGSSTILGSFSDTSGLSGGSISSNSANAIYCVPGSTDPCNPPIGEWKMEEGAGTDVFDTSGRGNTLTASTTTIVSGKYGKARNFTGATGSKVEGAVTGLPLGSSARTINAWFKTSDTTARHRSIAAYGTAAGGKPIYLLDVNATHKLYTESGSGQDALQSTASVNDGKWHFGSLTYNGTTLKLYLDGVLQGSSNCTLATATSNFGIGEMIWDTSLNFIGDVDNVQLYNYARSASQIAWDYNNGKPVGYWKFNECSGNTAYDSSGNNNNGTITIGGTAPQSVLGTCTTPTDGTGAWYNGRNGKYNSSISLDGTDDTIPIANESKFDFERTNPFTISAWIKPNANRSGNYEGYTIASKLNYSPGEPGFTFLTQYGNPSCGSTRNNLQVWLVNQWAGNNRLIVIGTADIPNGIWQHVVMTYDGSSSASGVKLYINGVADTLQTGASCRFDTLSGSMLNNYNLTIGSRSTLDAEFYKGLLDDVKIYNYPLTRQQVLNDYNQSSAVRFGPSSGNP